jgi:hypothetical protein
MRLFSRCTSLFRSLLLSVERQFFASTSADDGWKFDRSSVNPEAVRASCERMGLTVLCAIVFRRILAAREGDRDVSARLPNSLNSSLTSTQVVVPYACY